MDKPLKNLEPDDKENKLSKEKEYFTENHEENYYKFPKEKISNKLNPNLNPENNFENKNITNKSIKKEKKKENQNSNTDTITNSSKDINNSISKYSNEIEVIISNAHNQNFKKRDYHYGYNCQRQRGSSSFKKHENTENSYQYVQELNKNTPVTLDNSINQSNNFAENMQSNLGFINLQNDYLSNNINTNNYIQNNNYMNNYDNIRYGSYYRNSLKNSSKSENRGVQLNQNNLNKNYINNNLNYNNINNNINNNFQHNVVLNPINNSNQNTNNNFYQNNYNNEKNENINYNFIMQIDDQISYKNKKNKPYNKIKIKKISKQNNFVNSYDKTTDFSSSKTFMNLNLKFLKQTYKIRDLNIVDYEMENMKTDKSKKNKKNQTDVNNMLFGFAQEKENYNKNNNNAFSYDNQNENYGGNNKNSSSEEMPTLNFINPYFFNNSQNQALSMYNYNVLIHNPNILHQNLNMNSFKNKNDMNNNLNDNNLDASNFANNNLHNFKNSGHIHNLDMNYLSDEKINYDEKYNNNNFDFGNNIMNPNLAMDNPLNQLRLKNQIQMGQNNNFYDNMQKQNYNNFVDDPKVLEEYILSGRYLTGVIRINKCHTHAYITVAGLFNDILIRGNRNLNQSLHLDEVIVELFPVVCWKPLFNKKNRKTSYNNPKEDTTQQNILNMLRYEAANNTMNKQKSSIGNGKENLIPMINNENNYKKSKKNSVSLDKKIKTQCISRKSNALMKPDNVEQIKSEERKPKEENINTQFIQNQNKVENNINVVIKVNETEKNHDNYDFSSDNDDLSDSEPSDDFSQELLDSDVEDNLGEKKINSKKEKNYLLDDDENDDEDYQISHKKMDEINFNNQNSMLDTNYGIILFIKLIRNNLI